MPIHHSLPGAACIIYLNFLGMKIENTAWNSIYPVPGDVFRAKPYSADGNYASFSAFEKSQISLIWRRVAEDFAPSQVDVTTERPATFTSTTGMVLITESITTDGYKMPGFAIGYVGVALVNVFGDPSYST